MIAKNIFGILLCIHILGDFYFQTEQMARAKQTSLKALGTHIVLYGFAGGLLMKVLLPALPLIYILLFVSVHGVIDGIKYISGKRAGCTVFVVDQVLHLLAILGITCLAATKVSELEFCPWMIELAILFGADWTNCLSWGAKILLLHKPMNILIGQILQGYKPTNGTEQNTEAKKAGRYIGTLERLIMVVLISLNQYSAVGLVLTAKSIARFDRISNDQEFAEYYLLGTLLSTICAILIAVLV